MIFNYYDLAYEKLKNYPYFILNYSRNLEYRGDENSVKALEIIEDYIDFNEGIFNRNSNFIHQKATLNFKLAKIYFEDHLPTSEEYFHEAEELFKIKL